MSAPLSFDRVLSALRQLFPIWVSITRPAGVAPAAGDSSIGKELGSLAYIAARLNDRVEAMLAELFPNTASESIARWELTTRTAAGNSNLTLAQRQARVLSVLRRSGGVQLTALANALYAVLGLSSPDLITFFEPLREQIDAALTLESGPLGTAIPTTPALYQTLGAPWPGVVDDLGVQVYLELSAFGTPVATLTSPAGIVWTIPVTSAADYYENRIAFLGQVAGGQWTLAISDASGGKTLTQWSIRVSNDIDSAQIYNFFLYRDLSLPGVPDTAEAQRQFNRAAMGHMSPYVVEREAFVVGDIHSLTSREPIGA